MNVNAGETDGAGTITFSGDIGFAGGGDTDEAGVLGNTVIGNSTTASITFAEDLYSFGTGSTNIQATSAGTGETIILSKNASTAAFKTSGGTNATIEFETGEIDLEDGTNLSITTAGGQITVSGIAGHSSETVTITTGSGATTTEKVIIGDIGNPSANEIFTVDITAPDGITLNASNINTADGAANPNITFTGPVIVSGDVTVSADNATNDGAIEFTSTIDGAASGDNDLTVLSGAGTLTFTGDIGASTALRDFTVNSSDTGTGDTAAISIANIGDTGAVSGSANAGARTVTLGSTDTTSVTLSGGIYRTDGNFVVTSKSGSLITFSGASPLITTSGDLVDLNANVKINNNKLTVESNFGNTSSNGGNVEFAGTIAGASNENLIINTGTQGTGSVTLSGNVGSSAGGAASEISTVSVTAPTAITLGGDIVTSGDDGDASHPDITLTGPVVLAKDGTISLITDVGATTDGDITIAGTLNGTNLQTNALTITSGAGAVSISGLIGAGSNGALGNVAINNTNTTDTGAITLAGIGSGTTASGAGIVGTVNIGSNKTATLTLGGTTYNTDGNTSYQSITGSDKILITEQIQSLLLMMTPLPLVQVALS